VQWQSNDNISAFVECVCLGCGNATPCSCIQERNTIAISVGEASAGPLSLPSPILVRDRQLHSRIDEGGVYCARTQPDKPHATLHTDFENTTLHANCTQVCCVHIGSAQNPESAAEPHDAKQEAKNLATQAKADCK